jgi:hypothetical protein
VTSAHTLRHTHRTASVSTNVCCPSESMSFGNAASRPSMRERDTSMKLRPTSADCTRADGEEGVCQRSAVAPRLAMLCKMMEVAPKIDKGMKPNDWVEAMRVQAPYLSFPACGTCSMQRRHQRKEMSQRLGSATPNHRVPPLHLSKHPLERTSLTPHHRERMSAGCVTFKTTRKQHGW